MYLNELGEQTEPFLEPNCIEDLGCKLLKISWTSVLCKKKIKVPTFREKKNTMK